MPFQRRYAIGTVKQLADASGAKSGLSTLPDRSGLACWPARGRQNAFAVGIKFRQRRPSSSSLTGPSIWAIRGAHLHPR